MAMERFRRGDKNANPFKEVMASNKVKTEALNEVTRLLTIYGNKAINIKFVDQPPSEAPGQEAKKTVKGFYIPKTAFIDRLDPTTAAPIRVPLHTLVLVDGKVLEVAHGGSIPQERRKPHSEVMRTVDGGMIANGSPIPFYAHSNPVGLRDSLRHHLRQADYDSGLAWEQAHAEYRMRSHPTAHVIPSHPDLPTV